MLLGIVLIISIVFTVSARENLNYKTQLADQIFRGSLSQAQSGFAMDYSKMNEDEKIFYYLKTSSCKGGYYIQISDKNNAQS